MKTQIGKATILNFDCVEYMKTLPDKHFDLAVCDPPYGIGMDGGNVGYKGFNNFEKKSWDSLTPDYYYFSELIRVSKNQIIWGGNYFDLQPTRCFLIWDKGERDLRAEHMQNASKHGRASMQTQGFLNTIHCVTEII